MSGAEEHRGVIQRDSGAHIVKLYSKGKAGGIRELTPRYHKKDSLVLEAGGNKMTHSPGCLKNCQSI